MDVTAPPIDPRYPVTGSSYPLERLYRDIGREALYEPGEADG